MWLGWFYKLFNRIDERKKPHCVQVPLVSLFIKLNVVGYPCDYIFVAMSHESVHASRAKDALE